MDDDVTIHTDSVNAGGIEFGLLVADPGGDAPLALCLHGYPDSAWTWRHLLPVLARHGYRAVAPFSRGYAPTEIPADGRFQSGVLGVDANNLHEALGGSGEAVLIGHDWGAMAAYSAATLEPARWRAVVAAAVPPGPVTAQGFLQYDQLRLSWYIFFQLTPLADAVVAMDDHAFIRRLWQDWSPGYDCGEDVARFVECMPAPANLAAALSYYRQTLGSEPQDPSLAEAQGAVYALPPQPLLYLHGTDDGCMSPTLAATTEQHLSVDGSRAVMVENTGHFLHLERPDVVNAEILAFLGSR
jgi:pimeloyl-ACP methyl ester carboxylesterase